MKTRTASLLLVTGLALAGTACGGSTAKAGAQGAAPAAAGATTTVDLAAAKKAAESAIAGQGGGDDGPEGDGGRGPGGPGGFGNLDGAARALGMTTADLQAAVQGGQTIAQVAAAKGVGVDVVVAAMVADMKAHFEPEVASGEHTQAEVDGILADATQAATAVVNGQQPAMRPGDDGGPDGGDDGPQAGTAGQTGGARKANRATTTTTSAA